jgi:phage-related tail protein
MNKKLMKKIRNVLESFDMKPLEEGISKINRKQSECYSRIFELENELQQHKTEEENKYRDVVRKVLDMDNKFTRKFNLLGETIIELGKKNKKD